MGANREVVDKAYKAFSAGDIPAILELLGEDVEWLVPATLPQGGTFRGKEGVLKFFEGLGASWDPLVIEIEVVDDLGRDEAIGIVRGSGSLRGGAPAEYGAVHVFTVRDGLVTRFREFVDLDAPLA